MSKFNNAIASFMESLRERELTLRGVFRGAFILLALVCVSASHAAVGDVFTYNNIAYKITADSAAAYTVEVSNNVLYTGNKVVIPDSVSYGTPTIKYAVTAISSGAFRNNSAIDTVNLSGAASLETINNQAFYGCFKLKYLLFPSTLREILSSAFQTSPLSSTVQLPDSLARLDYMAFSKCDSIVQFRINAANRFFSVRDSILFNKQGNKLLIYPTAKQGLYEIPIGTDSIDDYAFYGCTGLDSVTLLPSLNHMGTRAFMNCNSLRNLTIPYPFTQIGGNEAFGGCGNLTKVNLPSSLRVINAGSFQGCERLHRVNLPDSLSYIGHSAFYNNDLLDSIVIPPLLDSIGRTAFYDNKILRTLDFNQAKSLKKIGEAAFSFTDIDSLDLSGCTALRFPEGSYIFRACEQLKSLILPSSVVVVEFAMLAGCPSLSSVVIPDSVKLIKEMAFTGCYRLSKMELPASLDSIGDYAFGSCISLAKVVNKSSVPQKLGNRVFHNVRTDTCKLYVPCASEYLYQNAAVWKNFDIYCFSKVDVQVNDTLAGKTSGDNPFVIFNDTDTLTATPTAGYEFAYWKDTLGNIVSYNDTIILTVTQDTTLIAYFRPEGTSSDATLLSLAPSAGVLSPVFAPDIYQYTDTVPYAVDSIRFYAQTTDAQAVINAADTVWKPLSVGDNPFRVRVTSSDGWETAEYFVHVYRLNNNAYLHELSVTNTELSPAFDSAYYAYSDTVEYAVSQVDISAVLSDPKAELSGDTGIKNLTVDWNTFNLLVRAEDRDTTRTYTINIYRKAEFEDTDAQLLSLVINGNEQLNAPTNKYNGHYEGNCAEAEFQIALEIPDGATLSIPSDFTYTITKLAGQDTINFTITSKDGSTTTSHQLILERRLPFDGYVETLWNYNTLMLDIKKANEGGLDIEYGTHYRWYRNGIQIQGMLPTYSAGEKASDRLENGAYYYLQIKTLSGETVRTCEQLISYDETLFTPQTESISVYPNPVKSGTDFYVELDEKEFTTGALLEIYNMTGICIERKTTTENPVKLNIAVKGVYLLKTASGTTQKITVK